MSLSRLATVALFFIILFPSVFVMSTIADSDLSTGFDLLGGLPNTDIVLPPGDFVTFAGKITDPDSDKWQNGYMVIAFLDDKEVARTTSRRDKFPESGEGVHDGLFQINIENVYELTPEHMFKLRNGAIIEMKNSVTARNRVRYVFHWFEERLEPNDILRIKVPDKQIEYALVILPVLETQLPDSIINGSTILLNNGKVMSATTGYINETNKDHCPAYPREWNIELTGFSGSPLQVWNKFIAKWDTEMTWEEFKEQVTVCNPILVQEDYEFDANNTYFLPASH